MRHRLAIISLLYMVPITVLFALFVMQARKEIDFSAKELAGSAYLQALFPVQHALTLASAGLPGSTGTPGQMETLQAAAGEMDEAMGSAKETSALRQSMQRVPWPTPAQASPAALEQALEAVRTLHARIGDGSNLILDPDLDSYYLMDIVVIRVPDLLRFVARARQVAESAGGPGAARESFLVDTGRADVTLSAIRESLARSIASNAAGDVGRNLSETRATFEAAAKAYLDEATALGSAMVARPGQKPDSAALTRASERLLGETSRLFGMTSRELDRLLALRVQGFKTRLWAGMLLGFCAILIAVVFAHSVGSSILRRTHLMRAAIDRIATGDVTSPVPGVEEGNEIGGLARAVQRLRDATVTTLRDTHAREIETRLKEGQRQTVDRVATEISRSFDVLIQELGNASRVLVTTARSVTSNTQETQAHAATSAQQIDLNNGNIMRVAQAVHELAQSTREIAQQSNVAATIAERARQSSSRVNEVVRDLGSAIGRISEIGDLIAGIASQTNLLALNATIEAARAGDAGRGFAVVAQEVKALAAQTAGATGDIAGQIAAVRRETDSVANVVSEVIAIIEEINGISGAIAAATEQQSATTDEVNANVEQTASASEVIATVLKDVAGRAVDTSERAGELLDLSQALSTKATDVETTMDRLLTELRAA
jgi:methyl-accepting chemotaxis protein